MVILVTELPYQTNARRSPGASRTGRLRRPRQRADVNDNSAEGRTELAIYLKRDANANVVLNNLYKLTQLQSSFSINMVALVNGVPRTLNLADALRGYVDHQVEVITRRSEYRLARAQEREHLLEGRVKALDVIDEIIALIRGSEDANAAKTGLMSPPFEFSEAQAIDILDMQLRRLTRLSRIDLERELGEIREQIRELQLILGDRGVLNDVLKTELSEIREKFATPRVCQLALDSGDMSIEDLVDDKELVVVMTQAQYVKAVPAASFKTQSRGGRGVSGAKLKTDDLVRHVLFHVARTCCSSPTSARSTSSGRWRSRARTPGQGHADRQPVADAAGRDGAGDHRHARLRRRALLVLRHVRARSRRPPSTPTTTAAVTDHRDQPQRRRRAGEGHRDRWRRRHLHGQPPRHDDPFNEDDVRPMGRAPPAAA